METGLQPSLIKKYGIVLSQNVNLVTTLPRPQMKKNSFTKFGKLGVLERKCHLG